MFLTKMQEKILVAFQDSDALTAHEVCDKLDMKYSTVSANLKKLHTYGCLARDYTVDPDDPKYSGNKYKFVSGQPSEKYFTKLAQHRTKVLAESKTPTLSEKELFLKKHAIKLGIEDIESLMHKWSEQKWYPKIFRSARNLPLSLARLYELAVSVAYGSVVSNEELYGIEEDLKAFQADLLKTLEVINGILRIESLKNPDKLYSYLLAHTNIEEAKQIALKVKELN